MTTICVYIGVAAFAGLFAGYAWGRHFGVLEGRAEVDRELYAVLKHTFEEL